MFCLDCLERRIGRKLTAGDFRAIEQATAERRGLAKAA
jgi:hypothetical protein